MPRKLAGPHETNFKYFYSNLFKFGFYLALFGFLFSFSLVFCLVNKWQKLLLKLEFDLYLAEIMALVQDKYFSTTSPRHVPW